MAILRIQILVVIVGVGCDIDSSDEKWHVIVHQYWL